MYSVLNTNPTLLQRVCEDLDKLTYREMMQLAGCIHTALCQEWQIVDATQMSIDDVASALSVAAGACRSPQMGPAYVVEG